MSVEAVSTSAVFPPHNYLSQPKVGVMAAAMGGGLAVGAGAKGMDRFVDGIEHRKPGALLQAAAEVAIMHTVLDSYFNGKMGIPLPAANGTSLAHEVAALACASALGGALSFLNGLLCRLRSGDA